MIWKFVVPSLLSLTGLFTFPRLNPEAQSPSEQRVFAMEGVVISHPADVPEKALAVLRKSPAVLDCIEKDQSAEDIPAIWFVASEVHLRGTEEVDLVVQPRDLTATSPDKPTSNACLVYAHTVPFWVLRKTADGCVLVLEESTQVLRILDNRSQGYRDIESSLSTTLGHTKLLFKFDGQRYKLFRKHTLPV